MTNVNEGLIRSIIEQKLNNAYSEILDKHEIESGDIGVERKIEMDELEEQLVEKTAEWVDSRISEVESVESDFERVTVKPGEYEVTDYTPHGGSHSGEYLEVTEPVEGVAVEDVYEQKKFKNVALKNAENHARIFLLVPVDEIRD